MKKLLAFALAATLLITAAPLAFADATNMIVLGDKLMSVSPSIINERGYTYVPIDTLRAYMGFASSYVGSHQAIAIGNSQLSFALTGENAGTCETTHGLNKASVSISAFIANATVYLPAEFVCKELGFSYRRLQNGVLRIFTGELTLTDAELVESMQSGSITPVTPDDQPPDVLYLDVYLVFSGLSESTPDILGLLAAADERATFFLSIEDIASSPQLVRDTMVAGHGIGLALREGDRPLTETLDAANDMLQLVTRTRATLVLPDGNLYTALTPEQYQQLSDAGYRVWRRTTDLPEDGEARTQTQIMTRLQTRLWSAQTAQVVLCHDMPELPELLSTAIEYMQERKVTIRPIEDTLPLP